jgi:type I restriction enzyme S subunit
MAKTTYREWFVNFRFPDRTQTEMQKSELRPIPRKVGTVSGLLRISREGITPQDFGEDTFLHFRIPAFDQGRMPLAEKGKTIKSNKYVVCPGCILLSKLNARIHRIWIPSIVGPHRAIASTEFLVLIPTSADGRNYLFHVLCSDEFQGRFINPTARVSEASNQGRKPDDQSASSASN